MSLQRSIFGVARGVRSISNSASLRCGPTHPGYKQIKTIQEKYLTPDGTPIFIKGGVMDSILYKLTMGLCVGAVIWDCKFYYDLAMK